MRKAFAPDRYRDRNGNEAVTTPYPQHHWYDDYEVKIMGPEGFGCIMVRPDLWIAVGYDSIRCHDDEIREDFTVPVFERMRYALAHDAGEAGEGDECRF